MLILAVLALTPLAQADEFFCGMKANSRDAEDAVRFHLVVQSAKSSNGALFPIEVTAALSYLNLNQENEFIGNFKLTGLIQQNDDDKSLKYYFEFDGKKSAPAKLVESLWIHVPKPEKGVPAGPVQGGVTLKTKPDSADGPSAYCLKL